MTATPLPALIAVHAIRLLGFTFIVLYAEGRLPAPFRAKRRLGRCLHRRDRAAARLGGHSVRRAACDRSSSYGTRSASPIFSPLSHSGGLWADLVHFRFSSDRRTSSPL